MFSAKRKPRSSHRFWNWLDAAEKENITGDSDEQKNSSGDERSGKRMRGLYDVSGDNGRGDSGKLVAQIQNSAKSADTFARSNQRRDRPSHRGSGGQPADGHADPEQCTGDTVGLRRAKDS